MILIFVKLFLAHLIGDFMLQPSSWVLDKEAKKHRSSYLYLHTFLHFILALFVIFNLNFIWCALVLAFLHGTIDLIKLFFQNSKTRRVWFLLDQIIHIIILIIISYWYDHQKISFIGFTSSFWMLLTGFIFVTKPTSILIKNIISVWTPETKPSDDSLQNAGNYIGILERLLIVCFILTHHFEAIGFLLAAKSIFRFGDLKEAKDRKLTEYVLIGTLLSFGIAIVVGLLLEFLVQFKF